MKRAPFLIVPIALLAGFWVVVARAPGAGNGGARPAPHRDPRPAPSLPVVPEREHPPPPPVEPGTAGAIQVHVTAAEGPLADARVMVAREDTHESFDRTTDASGTVLFQGLRPGEWLVGARHRRFPLAGDKTAVATGRTSEVALRMTEGGRAQGVVAGASGQPLAGATVVVLDPERRTELHQSLAAKTDERGQYLIEGIPLQKVGLAARAPKYKPVERYDIAFSAPGETQVHNFTLEMGTVVSGRVVDDAGAPIADAVITAGNEFGTTARTDREGRFTVYGLGEKPVGLSASARGFGTAFRRGVPPNTLDLEFQLFRGGRIEGRVEPALDTFSLLLYRYEEDLGRELLVRTAPYRASRDGEFALTDVARGVYYLAIDAPGYETVSRMKVSVSSGESVTVTIEVRRK